MFISTQSIPDACGTQVLCPRQTSEQCLQVEYVGDQDRSLKKPRAEEKRGGRQPGPTDLRILEKIHLI